TGFLSGAYHRGKHVTGSWRTSDRLYSSDYLGRTAELVETLGEVARGHDATAAQVALAYVLRHPNVVAIPGAATTGQLAENAAAADLELKEDECEGLAEAASRCPAPTGNVSRPGLQAAKHWYRGARLLMTMAREDRRLKAVKDQQQAENGIGHAKLAVRGQDRVRVGAVAGLRVGVHGHRGQPGQRVQQV